MHAIAQIFTTGSSWSLIFAVLTNRKLLGLKQLRNTIDNTLPFFAAHFANISLM